MQTAKQFAETLADTTQFREFEQSYFNFRQDAEAQSAIREFQEKQASLRALLMLNAVSEQERQNLEVLQEHIYRQHSVLKYTRAQEELAATCQQIGDLLSETIGLDYGTSCRSGGCCG
jgi:cell fate (sporulation/competence/biofilm development) regulator YlbF (YheA/YmcA/DUF963 family)